MRQNKEESLNAIQFEAIMVSIVHCSGRNRSLHLLPPNSGDSGTASTVLALQTTYIVENEAPPKRDDCH